MRPHAHAFSSQTLVWLPLEPLEAMKTYSAPVTRIEEFTISEGHLNQERLFQLGKKDRKEGKPCASTNGAYLNGWYNPETDLYYIKKEAAHLL